MFLGTIVEAFVSKLFAGMRMRGCYQFRVTRNSDLFVEQEEVDDLLRAVEGELASRRYGDAVRLETAHDCPDEILTYLLGQFALTHDDLYKVSGPVNLSRLMALYDLVDRAELKYAAFTPSIPERLRVGSDLFATLRTSDILLHHPFQGFGPVTDFIKQAASDPQVLAIKQTLYRTGSDSAIVDALVEAAQAGKDVTVIIELRARFDEEANIELANKLQEAGAHVMYGVVGFKTHAKLVMVVRREEKGLRRYCHLGTGNYHAKTARLYTDYGLLTADEAIGEDIHEIFLQLTGLTRVPRLRKLLHAPFSLHQALSEDRARGRSCARRQAGAHHRQAQCAHGAGDHPGALSRLARGRRNRSDRARRLLPAAGRARHFRTNHSALDRRAISRTFARLLFRKRRRARSLLRQRRLDGPELVSPRSKWPFRWRPGASGARRRRIEPISRGRLPGLGAPFERRYSRAAGAGNVSAQTRLLSLYDERVALTET